MVISAPGLDRFLQDLNQAPQGVRFNPYQNRLQQRTQIANTALDGINPAYRSNDVRDYYGAMLFDDMTQFGADQIDQFQVMPIEIRYFQEVLGLPYGTAREIYDYLAQINPDAPAAVIEQIQANPQLAQQLVFELSGGNQNDFQGQQMPMTSGMEMPNLVQMLTQGFGPEGLATLTNANMALKDRRGDLLSPQAKALAQMAAPSLLGPLALGRMGGSNYATRGLAGNALQLDEAGRNAFYDAIKGQAAAYTPYELAAANRDNRSRISRDQASQVGRVAPTDFARDDGSMFGPNYFGAIGAGADLPSALNDRTGVTGFRDVQQGPFGLGLSGGPGSDTFTTTPQYDMGTRAGRSAYESDFDQIERDAFGGGTSYTGNTGTTAGSRVGNTNVGTNRTSTGSTGTFGLGDINNIGGQTAVGNTNTGKNKSTRTDSWTDRLWSGGFSNDGYGSASGGNFGTGGGGGVY